MKRQPALFEHALPVFISFMTSSLAKEEFLAITQRDLLPLNATTMSIRYADRLLRELKFSERSVFCTRFSKTESESCSISDLNGCAC